MKKAFKTVIILLIFALLTSCTVAQTLNFNSKEDYSGSSVTYFTTDDFFVSVVEDLSDWQENGNNNPIMDVAVSEFRDNVEASSVTSKVTFSKLGENVYGGVFAFSDFQQLTKDLSNDYPDQKLVTLTKTQDGKTRFCIDINLDTYDVLVYVIPFLDDDNFKVWGPVYNNPPYDTITEEDYKDMVAWVLGEDGPESIDNSTVTIQVNLPGEIKATNGEVLGDNSVLFSFPLIDFLLLHENILLWCEF